MATELAKAYVQIVPSAKGIKGKITEELGGEAASAGSSAGESFGQNLVGKIKTVIAAAGLGKLLSSAISEGANLEQSIGGVETLFKDSADQMKAYAKDAYKTAGLSANDYGNSNQLCSKSGKWIEGRYAGSSRTGEYRNCGYV